MKKNGLPPQTIFRNLALASTVVCAIFFALSAMPDYESMGQFNLPTLVIMALLWVTWHALRSFDLHRQSRRRIISTQGPGGKLSQKATLYSFRQSEAFEEGDEAELCFIRAEQHYGANHYQQAADQYPKSIRARPALPAYLNLGNALLNISDFAVADEVLKLGLQLAHKQQDVEFEAAFQANIGVLYACQARLETALQAYKEALPIFRRLGDKRGCADLLVNIGHIHAHRGNWVEGRQGYESALKIYRHLGSSLGRANVIGSLGNMYAHQDLLDEAVKHYLIALKIHERIDNSIGRANVLTNIGNMHFREERLDEARRSYEATLELHRELADPLGEATVQGNIGNVYFKEGQLKKALTTYDRALQMHKDIGNPLGQANVLTNIGSVLSREDKNREALEVLEQARIIYQDVGARNKGLQAVEKLIERLQRRLPKRT